MNLHRVLIELTGFIYAHHEHERILYVALCMLLIVLFVGLADGVFYISISMQTWWRHVPQNRR